MASHNLFGSQGEEITKAYLEQNGYEILERNWRFMKAEIDLIAAKDSRLIFAEVKTRSGSEYGQPEEFVSKAKMRLMALAAEEYIYRKKHTHEVRFDIISILFDKFGKYKISHIEDAFWP